MDSKMNAAILPLAGRILLSIIFIGSGLGKLMDPAGTIGYIAHVGLLVPPAAYAVSLVIELGGGIALFLGLFTRWVALALAVFCLVTAFAVHGFADIDNQRNALKNIAMAGGFLFVMAHGAGLWSLDAMMSRRSGYSAQPA